MSDDQPTPLRQGDTGVITEPGAALDAVKAILEDARDWGMLGIDLEWDKDEHITWIGLGTARWAVSLWRETLPDEALALIRDAMADETLPKLGHNGIQADKPVWEREVGPVCGVFQCTMLLHHAAFPGIAHDLQQVVSQFLVVPPWKAWRRDQNKALAAAAVEQTKAEKKAAKQAEHDARNKAKADAKAAKQAQKQAEHEAKLAAQLAEREAKKAQKQAEHEARNAERAAEKERRKAEKQAAHEARNAEAAKPKVRKPRLKIKLSDDNEPEGDVVCIVCGDDQLAAVRCPDGKWRCANHIDEVF